MYMRKSNGLNIDHWSTLNSTGNQSEALPFSKTRTNLLFRKSLMSLRKSPDNPTGSNL